MIKTSDVFREYKIGILEKKWVKQHSISLGLKIALNKAKKKQENF